MEINNLFSVKDKVVLVTGGARGIGRMISEAYILNGAKVYIASRDASACDTAARELTQLGPGTAHAIPADLMKLSECERLVSELSRREEQLHILVNNSGAAWGEPLETFPDHAWTKILVLNLQRVFTLTQMLLPLLSVPGKASAEGSKDTPAAIINIGSIDALRVPLIDNYSYSAAKAGLHHLTRVLSQKLGPQGITVNTLACGPFATKMMAHTLDAMGDFIAEGNPMGRIGLPGDVGGACLFLGSRAGSFINGATLNVDGGVHLSSKM